MIHGIGTDLVRVARFEQIYQRHQQRLVKHLLLPEELTLFERSKRPARFLAKHWAAKEAVVKALGTGFTTGMWLRDAGYVSDALGKPQIIWSNTGEQTCRQLGVGGGHLSLSDEGDLIIATAVLTRA